MSEVTALLERTRRRAHPAPGAFDRLFERRDRKRRRQRIAAVVVALAVAVVGSAGLLAALREEPRPGNSTPADISSSTVRELRPVWNATLDGPAASLGNRFSADEPYAPTIAGGDVIVGTEAGTLAVYPLDCGISARSTCAPRWTSDLREPIAFAPTVADAMIFVTTEHGGVYAFAQACATSTCAPLWKTHIGATLASSPVVGNGLVYGIGALDSTLYAYSENCNGTCPPLWTASLGPAADPSKNNSFLTDEATIVPLVQGTVVYAVGFLDHTMRAFDAKDGRLLWTGAPTERVEGGVRFNGPVVAPNMSAVPPSLTAYGAARGRDEIVFEAGTRVYAFHACSVHGAACLPDWISASMDDFVGQPVVVGDTLYVGTAINGMLGHIDAFNVACRSDGDVCEPLWRATIQGEVTEEPLTATGGDVIGVSNYANLVASVPTSCDPSACETGWTVEGITRPAAATAVADLVFVNTATGRLSAFPTNCDGVCRPLWTTQQGTAVSPPAISGRRLFVATSGGRLVAFAPTRTRPTAASSAGTTPIGIAIAAVLAGVATTAIWFSRRRRV